MCSDKHSHTTRAHAIKKKFIEKIILESKVTFQQTCCCQWDRDLICHPVDLTEDHLACKKITFLYSACNPTVCIVYNYFHQFDTLKVPKCEIFMSWILIIFVS
jgi:hypothetical protein